MKVLRLILLVLLVCLFPVTTTWAEGKLPVPSSAKWVLKFADELLLMGDSYRAATEYLRFISLYPTHGEVPHALEGLGKANAQAGRWPEAVSVFSRLKRVRPDGESSMLLGTSLYEKGDYGKAARTLRDPATGEGGETLSALASIRAGELEDASKLRPELVRQFEGLDRKSPGLAGTLSALLPGSGHLYVGRKRDAAVAFTVNALFIWGIVESIERENWPLTAILGLLEAGWYSGTVVGAVNGAHKWNRKVEGDFFRSRESAVVPDWRVVVVQGGGGLGFSWNW